MRRFSADASVYGLMRYHLIYKPEREAESLIVLECRQARKMRKNCEGIS